MRTLAEAALDASTCTKCRLSQGRTQVVYGVGDPSADLMFIGEAPGFHEDKQGEPFVGAAGQLLNQLLSEIEVPRSDVYINNVILCRPPGNRDPLPDELDACKPWLDERIAIIDPAVVVTLGNWATRHILGRQVSISRVRGQRFPWNGRTVIPTFHPAAVLHGGGQASNQMTALRADFQEIRAALAERPEPAEEQLGLFLMHLELRAATAEETRSIGGAISPLLSPGDAIALTGELGSGKTTFAQGLARGLGFEGHVVSPTFTLVREYRPARLPVVHADVYRLERVQDVLDLELEQSAEDGVLLVEWGDAVEALLPNGHLVVELATLDPGEERTIVLRTEGRSWLPRWERLERQLEPWRSDRAAGEAS